jgi:hypothetical protein
MSTRTAAILLTVCIAMIPLQARAVSLTLGPNGPTSAQDQVAVLYASRADGSTVTLARVGEQTIDGGQIDELGLPSETLDGHVVFGANVEDRAGRLAWDIFVGDPEAPAADRISRAIMPLELSRGCTPQIKVDPYPVATADGAIAFVAQRREGGEALFLYRSGRLDCLLRTGDRLRDGRVVARLSFGTVQAGAGDSLVLLALLQRGKADRAQSGLWWRDHLGAVLIVSPGHAAAEIAVEGAHAPRGGVFGALGPPAAEGQRAGRTLVAFTDQRGADTSLYLYRAGRLTRVLRNGSRSSAGSISFLSQGRPSLGAGGLIALRAASGDNDLIVVAGGGASRIVARTGELLAPGLPASNFGDPCLINGPRVYFPALAEGYESFFVRNRTGDVREIGQPSIREAAFDEPETAHHRVSSPTLTANSRGDFAYLGGR